MAGFIVKDVAARRELKIESSKIFRSFKSTNIVAGPGLKRKSKSSYLREKARSSAFYARIFQQSKLQKQVAALQPRVTVTPCDPTVSSNSTGFVRVNGTNISDLVQPIQ
ncbi:unnamed protein product [Allacma fusca]|uniref:Uncharacterized protein n=1 Tax=Allacma fusca TaxID=39272 RepID=A0A8J2PKP1_9HEXA|nr:unnamed protein product [Allacma fusca]